MAIMPLIGSYRQNVYIKHLKPGDYLVEKRFRIKGLGEYSKKTGFTII